MSGRLRWILLALAALVVLVGAAWAAVAILLPPERVHQLVAARLSAAVQREVRFSSAGVSIFPPVRLTVRDLALAAVGGFDAGRDFELQRLHLDIDVFALLRREIVVRRLVLESPRLRYLIRADGSTNFDSLMREGTAAEGGTGGSEMALAIQELMVRSGGLLLDDLRADRRIVLTLDSRLSLRQAGEDLSVDGSSTISDLALGSAGATRESGLRMGLAPVRWEIGHRGQWRGAAGQLELERLTLAFGRAEIACQGVIAPDAAAPRYKLRASADGVDLKEILGVLSEADIGALAGLDGSGKFACDLRIESPAAPGALPTLVGTAQVQDATVRYAGAPASIRDLRTQIRFAPDTLEVVDLRASVEAASGPPTPVQARLLASQLSDPLVRFAVQGTVNLEAVAPMVAAQGGSVSGRADLDVRGTGRTKDPGSFGVEGTAALREVRYQGAESPRPLEEVNGLVRFSTSRAAVEGLTMRAGESSLRLDATLERPLALTAVPGADVAPARVQFTLQSPYFDVNDFVASDAKRAPLPNVAGEGTVSIDRFRRDKLDARSVQARVVVTPTTVAVPEFSLEAYSGTTRGSAVFDYSQPERPGFAIDARATALDADQMLSTWTPLKGWVKGTLGTELQLSGAGSTPQQVVPTLTAIGLASLAQGSIGPGPVFERIAKLTGVPEFKEPKLKEGSIPFAIENGRFQMREVRWSGATGEWALGGSLGFTGDMDLDVHITLPPEAAARLGTAGRIASEALTDDAGRLLLDLRVTGPARSPEVAWDTRATRARLESRARDALQSTKQQVQQQALEALQQSLQGSADTASQSLGQRGQSLLDSLQKKGPESLLRGLLPPAPTPAPASAPVPPDTAGTS